MPSPESVPAGAYNNDLLIPTKLPVVALTSPAQPPTTHELSVLSSSLPQNVREQLFFCNARLRNIQLVSTEDREYLSTQSNNAYLRMLGHKDVDPTAPSCIEARALQIKMEALEEVIREWLGGYVQLSPNRILKYDPFVRTSFGGRYVSSFREIDAVQMNRGIPDTIFEFKTLLGAVDTEKSSKNFWNKIRHGLSQSDISAEVLSYVNPSIRRVLIIVSDTKMELPEWFIACPQLNLDTDRYFKVVLEKRIVGLYVHKSELEDFSARRQSRLPYGSPDHRENDKAPL